MLSRIRLLNDPSLLQRLRSRLPIAIATLICRNGFTTCPGWYFLPVSYALLFQFTLVHWYTFQAGYSSISPVELPTNSYKQSLRIGAAYIAGIAPCIVIGKRILLHVDGLGFYPLSIMIIGFLLIEAGRIPPHPFIGEIPSCIKFRFARDRSGMAVYCCGEVWG